MFIEYKKPQEMFFFVVFLCKRGYPFYTEKQAKLHFGSFFIPKQTIIDYRC